MRNIILDADMRPRPLLVTPAKGSVGDMVHEEDAAGTSIPSILQRYGGNLEDLVRWRKDPIPFDCDLMPSDLAEALQKVHDIGEMLNTLELPEGVSRDDAIAAIKSGDYRIFVNPNKEKSNEPQEKSEPPEESSAVS